MVIAPAEDLEGPTAPPHNGQAAGASGGASPRPPATTAPSTTIYYIQPYESDLAPWESAFGALFVFGWIAFFAFGLFVPTDAMRQVVRTGEASWYEQLGAGGASLLGYTLTNVLFLTCFASLIGCMSHRWQVASKLEVLRDANAKDPVQRIYFAAALRGFFIYLLFVAGFLTVTTSQSVEDTTPDQYIRIAGMMSIVGFILGFDANLLSGLIRRALNFADPKGASEGQNPANAATARAAHEAELDAHVMDMDENRLEELLVRRGRQQPPAP